MNSNVYHLVGPSGVKHATSRIKQVLEEEKHKYFLRIDIRSYYASIPHYQLLNDIKQYYHDPKIIAMLENIITNPIDTPRGTRNPSHGIALRAPLSQFFSALYLKPLDDALSRMDIVYVRYQDDVTQSTRERKANGRRSGLSCKDQTLFRSMGALVGKNSKHMGFSKSSRTIHYDLLAGRTGKHCRRGPLNSHY